MHIIGAPEGERSSRRAPCNGWPPGASRREADLLIVQLLLRHAGVSQQRARTQEITEKR